MSKTHEVTPFYIRGADGDCYYVETLEDAITEFVGENGYRLTLKAGDTEVVIRRVAFGATGELQGTVEYSAGITVRKKEI